MPIIASILDISINLFFVLQIVVCLLLLGIVLMQRPKQEGLGAAFGAALTDQAFGARTTDVLQKGTAYLGAAFMILSFVLALLIVKRNEINKLDFSQAPTAAQIEVSKDIVVPTETTPDSSSNQTPEAPAPTETPVSPVENK